MLPLPTELQLIAIVFGTTARTDERKRGEKRKKKGGEYTAKQCWKPTKNDGTGVCKGKNKKHVMRCMQLNTCQPITTNKTHDTRCKKERKKTRQQTQLKTNDKKKGNATTMKTRENNDELTNKKDKR